MSENSFIERAPHNRENPYKMISRSAMEDDRLSFEARGALAFILVKPDTWRVNVTNLRKEGKIGRDKAYSIITEWITHGYCTRVENREKGRVVGYTYRIHEFPIAPLTLLPDPAEPYTAPPDPANQEHSNKEGTSKEEQSTKEEGEKDQRVQDHPVAYTPPPPPPPSLPAATKANTQPSQVALSGNGVGHPARCDAQTGVGMNGAGGDYFLGFATHQPRGMQAEAIEYVAKAKALGIEAGTFREMVDALLKETGSLSLVNGAQTDNARSTHNKHRDVVIGIAQASQKVRTVADIAAICADYRANNKGLNGMYLSQFEKHAYHWIDNGPATPAQPAAKAPTFTEWQLKEYRVASPSMIMQDYPGRWPRGTELAKVERDLKAEYHKHLTDKGFTQRKATP